MIQHTFKSVGMTDNLLMNVNVLTPISPIEFADNTHLTVSHIAILLNGVLYFEPKIFVNAHDDVREWLTNAFDIFNAIGFHKNNMSNKCFMYKWNGGWWRVVARSVDVWIADDELLHPTNGTARHNIYVEQLVQIRVKMVNIHFCGMSVLYVFVLFYVREFGSQSSHIWKCSSGFVLCVKVIFAKDKLATCCTHTTLSTCIAASK